jgi:hypothetical protein
MTNSHLLAILKKVEADSGRLTTFITQQHYFGYIDWSFKLDYAGLPCRSASSRMTFNHIEPFHDDFLFLGEGTSYLPLFPFVFTGKDNNRIVFPDFQLKAPLELKILS